MIILLGHAVIICLMVKHTNLPRFVREPGFSSSPIHLMQILEAERKAPRPVDVAGPIQKLEPGVQESTAISEPVSPIEAQQEPRTEGPRIDWAKEATEVVRQMALPDVDAPPGKPPAGLFERVQPPHRAGDIEIFEGGIERRWVNSRCYLEFGRIPDLSAGTGPRVNPVRCFLGSGEVDGHLFDHLKPKYLRPVTPPAINPLRHGGR